MPMNESLFTEEERQSQSKEAHLIRTRDRITNLRKLAQSPHSMHKVDKKGEPIPPIQGEVNTERTLILEELKEMEYQLQMNNGIARKKNATRQAPANSMVILLKQELESLKNQVSQLIKGKENGAISKPETSSETRKT